MPSLTTVRFKHATGVAVAEDRLVATIVAATPLGARKVEEHSVPLGERDIAEGIEELKTEGRLKGTVVLGIEAQEVFFVTKKAESVDEQEDPRRLVKKHLTATGQSEDEYVADSVDVKLSAGQYYSLAACRKTFATSAAESLSGIPSPLTRLEPIPFALQRLAVRAKSTPRRWRTVIRILLLGSRSIAIVSVGDTPVAWRLFDCSPGSEVPSINITVLGLLGHIKHELQTSKLDGIILHGEEDVEDLAERCTGHYGIDTVPAPGVGTEQSDVAHALGLGGLRASSNVPNLFGELRPPPSLRDIFPWPTAILLSLVVLVCFFMIWDKAGQLENKCVMAKRQTASHAKASRVKLKDINKQHKKQKEEVLVAESFIGQRVFWAPIIRELPDCLPEGMVLTALRGESSMQFPDFKKKKKKVKAVVKKEFTVRGQVRVERKEAAPKELTMLLDALMQSTLIRKVFPKIEGATINRKPGSSVDLATFMVLCAADKR